MRRTLVVAAVSAGLVLTAPAAFAATSPSSSTAVPQPSDHVGVPKAFVHVLPKAARPGTKVEVRLGCVASGTQDLASPALTIGELRRVGPQDDPAKAPAGVATAVVKQVKPGEYPVSFSCGGAEISTKFTVLGDSKQVAKVPSGAPQTGGTDGPADDGTPSVAAGAAMGALALGGCGLVLARRTRRG